MKTKLLFSLMMLLSVMPSAFAGESLAADIERALERRKACLSENTEIKMSDNSVKKIQHIKTGDEILTASGDSAKVLFVVAGPEKTQMYRIRFKDNSEIEATKKHPFMSAEGVYLTSQELDAGTRLKSEDGYKVVASIKQFDYKKDVYNLILSEAGLFDSADRAESLQVNGETLNWKHVLRKRSPFLGLSDQDHSFIANDIISGDLVIQMGLQN
jgi:intein/homing endonuclease